MATHPRPRIRTHRSRRHIHRSGERTWLALLLHVALPIVIELIRAHAGTSGCGR